MGPQTQRTEMITSHLHDRRTVRCVSARGIIARYQQLEGLYDGPRSNKRACVAVAQFKLQNERILRNTKQNLLFSKI